MTKTIIARCADCAGWVPTDRPGPAVIGAPKIGLCRMFPPTPIPLYDESGRVSQIMHVRPTPPADDSCMHFVPREGAPEVPPTN